MGTEIKTIKALRALKKSSFVEQQISSGKNFFFPFFLLVWSLMLFIDFKIGFNHHSCVCVCPGLLSATSQRW